MGLSVSGLVLSLFLIVLGIPLTEGRGSGPFGLAFILIGVAGVVLCILQGTQPPGPARERPAPAPRGIAARLRELDALREQDLVDQEEWSTRRKAILDDL